MNINQGHDSNNWFSIFNNVQPKSSRKKFKDAGDDNRLIFCRPFMYDWYVRSLGLDV